MITRKNEEFKYCGNLVTAENKIKSGTGFMCFCLSCDNCDNDNDEGDCKLWDYNDIIRHSNYMTCIRII